jgi:uncharacterized protein (DUF1697 family)
MGDVLRYAALLRGLNVGGHRVKMDRLRTLFTEMGFAEVSTFIASGNVLFRAEGDVSGLEGRIERYLEAALGYAVATFLRTPAEMAAVAALRPFAGREDEGGRTLMVSFHKEPADEALKARLEALRTPSDDFRVHGREVYWLTGPRMSDSPVGPQVAKALARGTLRNATSVRKLAALLTR